MVDQLETGDLPRAPLVLWQWGYRTMRYWTAATTFLCTCACEGDVVLLGLFLAPTVLFFFSFYPPGWNEIILVTKSLTIIGSPQVNPFTFRADVIPSV